VTETTISTFYINNLFDEWVNKFDLNEATTRKAKNLKLFFRGVSKDNPHKVMVVVQAEEGVIGKHIQEILINLKKWCKYDYCCFKELA